MSGELSSPAAATLSSGQVVARNALWSLLTQVLNLPMSVLMNALIARHLGAKDFGIFFLVSTFVGFAGLVAESGQLGALQGAVARERASAGILVSSSIALRLVSFVVAHATLAAVAFFTRQDSTVLIVGAILALMSLVQQFGGSGSLAARSFERGDLVARNTLRAQLLTFALVIPTLLLGGRLVALLLAQLVATIFCGVLDFRLLAKLNLALEKPDVTRIKSLAREGVGFFLLSAILALQPNVDAMFMASLVPDEVIGWHAAARRLIGFLAFPAAAITSSLYPTLCRLRAESPEGMITTMRSALNVVTLVVLAPTLGCALYPNLGIEIFGKAGYGPAETNLRVMSAFVFFVYFSMALGTYIAALGKQRQWALVQLVCVLISVVGDPLLIPYFQKNYGNGGIGVSIATVLSEAAMVLGALALTPKKTLDGVFFRKLALVLLSGGAMVLVAQLTRSWNPWIAAPISLAVYIVALRVTGVLDQQQFAALKRTFKKG